MALNESSLEKRFQAVSTSQGSIQSLSFFCLHYKNHHKKIAQIWLRCLQKAKVSHRLTLIYLANDIVQNAKRKNTLSFIDDFKSILKDTVPYLRDEKIKKSVERVFSIWQDRNIFDAKFTTDLKNSLNDNHGRQPQQTANTAAPTTPQQKPIPAGNIVKHKSNDLIDSLERLAFIEKNAEKFNTTECDIAERLSQRNFTLTSDDQNNSKFMKDLKSYVLQLKVEVEERNNLNKLLEDSMSSQKQLLKESEEQLIMYKSQLEYVTKLKEDLRSPD